MRRLLTLLAYVQGGGQLPRLGRVLLGAITCNMPVRGSASPLRHDATVHRPGDIR